MEHKQVKYSTDEEVLNFFKAPSKQLVSSYQTNIKNAQKIISDLATVVFQYDLSLSEYEKTKRKIQQCIAIYTKAKYQDKGDTPHFIDEFDEVSHNFNLMQKKIKESIETLNSYLVVVESTIDKCKNNEQNIQPIIIHRGINSGYSDEQLKTLYKALIEEKFLDNQTDLRHFVDAFNGNVLEDNFKRLKWKDSTKGAIFISYFFRTKKNVWKNTKHLLEPANYSHLLYQSKGNSTFESATLILKNIENQIKL